MNSRVHPKYKTKYRVSTASPIGRVLLGKEEGDEVIVQRPSGPASFVVTGISY